MEVPLAFFGIIVTSIVFLLVRWVFKRKRMHNLFKRYGIPGPKPDFLGGNLYHLKQESTPNGVITKWLQQYGDVFGYYMGELPYIVVKDLDILKQVFNKDFSSFSNRPRLYVDSGPLLHSLVGLQDKRWKDVRTVITPMFTSGKMKHLSEIMAKKGELTVSLIVEKAKKGEIMDVVPMVQGLTLDIIASCALAMKTQCQKDTDDTLLVAVRKFLKLQHHIGVDLSLIFPPLGSLLEFLANYTSFGEFRHYILDHLTRVIKQRNQNPDFKSFDILQALLDKSKQNKKDDTGVTLTEEEVIANAFVVFIAGYETTATSLGYTIYLLVKHPEVQDRLYQEIINAEDCSYATLQNLQYLDQVYSEALRLYPPVTGFNSRLVDKDYTIGSFTFPKGSNILAPVWDIHHDPDLWPDPWKFDPERFSPSNKSSIKSMSYMPFGAGPRNCVGARFAQLEAKLFLFYLLKELKLEACHKTEEPLSLTCHTVITSPKNGVWIKAVPR